ncbi:MAG: hypothetical protein U0350_41175 [Caldilineaceae bacterium]
MHPEGENGKAAPQPPQKFEFEDERLHFKTLVLTNPNYFGNLLDSLFPPVTKIVNSTYYEQLTCVGFNPALNMLEATFQINQPFGYAGELCQSGTIEYVRFYMDYGAGWVDVGLAGVNVHDIPTGVDCLEQADKPLTYVVSVPIEPQSDYCGRPVLPRVRAILSWNLPPSDPLTPPVWGNTLDSTIQLKPRALLFGDLPLLFGNQIDQVLTLPPELLEVKLQPIPLPDPPPLALPQLVDLYAKPSAAQSEAGQEKLLVEPHRFAADEVLKTLNAPLFNAQLVTAKAAEFTAVGLNWQEIVGALQQTSGNTTYEKLHCVGLDYNREWLAATFVIDQTSGYAGGPCTQGSKEYVAFWVDWDNSCQWTYLGAGAVQVFDLTSLPAGGVTYTVLLPVDFDSHRQPCEKPQVLRVRAVLSWNTPPSTTDPEALPHWGNRMDAHVQIKPGSPTTLPELRAIGGINREDIDTGPLGNGMTIPSARFWSSEASADSTGLQRLCPFGGNLELIGRYKMGYKYRLSARKASDSTGAWAWIEDLFRVPRVNNSHAILQVANANHFFTYLDPSTHMSFLLANWQTSGDDLWILRFEVADLLTESILSTNYYRIQLDNTSPEAEIAIADGRACGTYRVGESVTGAFVARDQNFGSYTLITKPFSRSPHSPTPAAGATPTVVAPGNTWTLATGVIMDTPAMTPCGYIVELHVADTTIRDSQPGRHNTAYDDVGFCLQ